MVVSQWCRVHTLKLKSRFFLKKISHHAALYLAHNRWCVKTYLATEGGNKTVLYLWVSKYQFIRLFLKDSKLSQPNPVDRRTPISGKCHSLFGLTLWWLYLLHSKIKKVVSQWRSWTDEREEDPRVPGLDIKPMALGSCSLLSPLFLPGSQKTSWEWQRHCWMRSSRSSRLKLSPDKPRAVVIGSRKEFEEVTRNASHSP